VCGILFSKWLHDLFYFKSHIVTVLYCYAELLLQAAKFKAAAKAMTIEPLRVRQTPCYMTERYAMFPAGSAEPS